NCIENSSRTQPAFSIQFCPASRHKITRTDAFNLNTRNKVSQKEIEIKGARVHNLKNLSVKIPHGQLTVITGISGSGKSSLAFDTLYAEGQRRYIESLSS